MADPQTGGARVAMLRLAALTCAIVLCFLGAKDLWSQASTGDDDDPDYPGLFDDVAHYLKQYYLDQDRLSPRARKLTEKALSAIENAVDEIYVENSDPDDPHVVVHVENVSKPIS